MWNAKTILNMIVVNRSNGERIGRVKDLLIDPEQRQVVALLMQPRGLFRPTTAVLYQGVVNIGKDAVVISDDSHLVRADRHPLLKPLLSRDVIILGKPVMTEGGYMLGTIHDVVIEGSSGAVQGYVMSKFAYKGMPRGITLVLPASETLVVGRHLAMVTERVEYLLQQAAAEAKRRDEERNPRLGFGALWRWLRPQLEATLANAEGQVDRKSPTAVAEPTTEAAPADDARPDRDAA